MIPVETKLEGGFPDTVIIEKLTGRVVVCELKNIKKEDKDLKFRKNQPLFLRRWADLSPGVTRAWVMARVRREDIESGVYLWRANPSYDWVKMINGTLSEVVKEASVFFPEERSMPWGRILSTLFL